MPTVINTDHEVGGRANRPLYIRNGGEVALFKRNKSSDFSEPLNGASPLDPQFQRLSVREVLVFTSWGEGNLIVHFEKDGKNWVKANINSNWYELEVSSREAGRAMMNDLRADWKSGYKTGLFPETVTFYSYGTKSFGFADVNFDESPTQFTTDFIFTLGREFDEKFQSGWFPKTNTDLNLFFNFLVLAPIRVGFFGPYKYVLKAATNAFPQHLSEMTPEYASYFAAALGFGYGHLEGFLSHANLTPQFAGDWNIDELRHLPELGGFKYPTVKTVQYLLRKGWRFLDFLEAEAPPLVTTRFKTHILRGADTSHQLSVLEEERFLEYQQLTTRVIYGESQLAIRDRESRKVHLGKRYERHNLAVSKKFIASLTPEQIQVYKNWMTGLEGKNSAVTHYALELSRHIPGAVFNWTPAVVRTLITSESELARAEVQKAIIDNPSLLRNIPAPLVTEFLNTIEVNQLDPILEEIKVNAVWSYSSHIQHWVGSHLQGKLNERDLKIAKFFLLNATSSISNNLYTDSLPKMHTLFIQVAAQTKLQPFSEWAHFPHEYMWNEGQIYGFYGVSAHPKYPRGILDVLDIRNKEMLALFAQPISMFLKWYSGPDVAIRFLSTFYNSTKPGANELVWTILGNQSLAPEIQELFLEHLNSLDPSGAGYLRGISASIAQDDKKAIVRYLTSLSDESKDSFWRRNKGEMEELFMGWKGFPAFFWGHIDEIPFKIVEKIGKYNGLESKVLKLITPASIGRLSTAQIDYFSSVAKVNATLFSNSSMLRAMLIAPSAAINQIAADYVKNENKYAAHWLLMLESNLPVTQSAALRYLEGQIESKDFASKLLMALDSNNVGARKLAISVLNKIKSPSVLTTIVDGLVENRNTDTWKVVSKHLELISEVDKYKEFTSQVFLSRRKARTVKEEIKVDIEELIEDISEAVEKDTLIRMAHSSVAADRHWALKQIALAGIDIEGVLVETAWKGDLHV